jgi:arylsulfatase A-like enzyme
VPVNPAPEFRGKSKAGLYGDYVQQLDYCTGLVLDALAKHGFAGNTLVIFSSDNGGVYHRDALAAGHRCNAELLGQKTDGWEGGHRVPLIARWPGRIPVGSERKELFSQVDLMATIAEAAGVTVPAGASPDGASELAAFLDPAHAPAKRTEAVFLGTGGHVLRQGDWIYLPKRGSCGMTVQVPPGPQWGQPYATLGISNSDVDARGQIKPDAPPVQLYNLHDDLRQATNRFSTEPETAKRLAARLTELMPKRKAKQ